SGALWLGGGIRRRSKRLLGAPMTRVTSHVHLAVRELAIDIPRQHDHFPRDILGWLLVAGEVACHMAEVALLAQRDPERHPGRPKFGGVQQFQVLRSGHLFVRRLTLGGSLWGGL